MNENSIEPTRRRGFLLLGVVFLLGMLCGAALFYLGQRSAGFRPPGPPPEHPLARLSREVGLDREQEERIRAVLDRRRRQIDDLLEESHSEIRDLLRPDQQERFDDLRPPRPGPGRPGGPPPHPPGPGHPRPQPPPPRP